MASTSDITPPASPLRASTPTAPPAPKKKERPSLAERRGRLQNIPKLVLPDGEEKPELPEWRVLAQSGWVRAKFLRYNPEDVEELDDFEMLMKLKDWYFPSSQPQNLFEETYCVLMREAADKKLYNL